MELGDEAFGVGNRRSLSDDDEKMLWYDTLWYDMVV